MFNFIYKYYLNFNFKIKKILNFGFVFSFLISLFSAFILSTYFSTYTNPILYYVGISVFKLSIIYLVTFICFSFAFNKILDDIT